MNYESVKTILPEKNKEDWNGNREDIIKFKILVTRLLILSVYF